jgi:hypothetical protein
LLRIDATDQGFPPEVRTVSAKSTESSLPSRHRTERSRSLQIRRAFGSRTYRPRARDRALRWRGGAVARAFGRPVK